MIKPKRFKLLVAAQVLGLATTLAACAPDPYYSPRPIRHRPVQYYDYHYYPSVDVYFHLYSGRYYYRPGRSWVGVRILPSHVYIGPRERVHLRIWSDRPYIHHEVHRKHYRPPPGYHPSHDRDRYERRYNRTHHERYLKRYRP